MICNPCLLAGRYIAKWPTDLLDIFVNVINALIPRQNGHHFADDIFKCIFLNENVWILIRLSQKFVLRSPIDNKPTLVQVMAWRRNNVNPVHWRINAPLGGEESRPGFIERSVIYAVPIYPWGLMYCVFSTEGLTLCTKTIRNHKPYRSRVP